MQGTPTSRKSGCNAPHRPTLFPARGKNLFGGSDACAIGAVRRRVIVLRAGLAGKEQSTVHRRGQRRAAVHFARKRVGVGAARERIRAPMVDMDRLEALDKIVAENSA